MSDFEHSRRGRDYPYTAVDTGGSGIFWLLVVIAAVGLLFLIIALGSGPTTVDHPGGAGADPVIVPSETDASSATTGTATE